MRKYPTAKMPLLAPSPISTDLPVWRVLTDRNFILIVGDLKMNRVAEFGSAMLGAND